MTSEDDICVECDHPRSSHQETSRVPGSFENYCVDCEEEDDECIQFEEEIVGG